MVELQVKLKELEAMKAASEWEHDEESDEESRGVEQPWEFSERFGDERRMALDGFYYTASEFCEFYGSEHEVRELWFGPHGNGLEDADMLHMARMQFNYLMN